MQFIVNYLKAEEVPTLEWNHPDISGPVKPDLLFSHHLIRLTSGDNGRSEYRLVGKDEVVGNDLFFLLVDHLGDNKEVWVITNSKGHVAVFFTHPSGEEPKKSFDTIIKEFATAVHIVPDKMPTEERTKEILSAFLEENDDQYLEDEFQDLQISIFGEDDCGLIDPSYVNELIEYFELPFELEQVDYSWLVSRIDSFEIEEL